MADTLRPPAPGPVCGTALASMSRMERLHLIAAHVDVVARVAGDEILATLRVRDAIPAEVASSLPVQLNVHHATNPSSGYPFLGSELGVRIAADAAVTVKLPRAGKAPGATIAIVLQTADAFEGRLVTLGG